VRDILQNHLTEVLALAAMDLPESTQDQTQQVLEAKLKLLENVEPVSLESMLLGQYQEYVAHARADYAGEGLLFLGGNKRNKNKYICPPDPSLESATATFAAAALSIRSPHWKDVPFVLVTGKQVGSGEACAPFITSWPQMAERRAYVRYVFEPSTHTVYLGQPHCGLREIRFHIQGGGLEPCVLVVGNFSGISAPSGWKVVGSPETGQLAFYPGAGGENGWEY
jgi:hypothetical protein